jgi:hypothetical protein
MSGVGGTGISQTLAAALAGRDTARRGSGIAPAWCLSGSTVICPVFDSLADVTGTATVSWRVLVRWLLCSIGLLGWVWLARPFPLRKESVRMSTATATSGTATPTATPVLARQQRLGIVLSLILGFQAFLAENLLCAV